MNPIPRRLPLLTASLLAGGMGLFLLQNLIPLPALLLKLSVFLGMAAFFAGLVVALAGMAWSIWTLTSPPMRRARGVATPVVVILIAVLAWSGAALTIYKFKQSRDAPPKPAAELPATPARVTPPGPGA